jgi:hypothetical protein
MVTIDADGAMRAQHQALTDEHLAKIVAVIIRRS